MFFPGHPRCEGRGNELVCVRLFIHTGERDGRRNTVLLLTIRKNEKTLVELRSDQHLLPDASGFNDHPLLSTRRLCLRAKLDAGGRLNAGMACEPSTVEATGFNT